MKNAKTIMRYNKFVFTWKIRTGIIFVLLFLSVFMLIWDTSEIQRTLDEATEHYVEEVSYQLKNDISSRLNAFLKAVAQTSAVISEASSVGDLSGFLSKQAQIQEFDSLILINDDGTTVPQNFDIQGLSDLSGVKASFEGESSIVYASGQSLIFSVPVYEDGQVVQVLAGVRKKENIQKLIQPEGFNNKGLTCIVDSQGKVVISPTDLEPFLQLNDIFKEGQNKSSENAVRRMEQDLKEQNSGVFQFTSVNGMPVMMSYHSLNVNDWILLTLIPQDLISKEVGEHVMHSFIFIGSIVVIFILFLVAIIRFYSRNKKYMERIAFTDSLTGGPNWSAFRLEYEKLKPEIRPNTRSIVFLNIRDFKFINSNMGVSVGNEVLKYVSEVIQRHIQPGETGARADGDHFLMCLTEREPEKIQERLDEMVREINTFRCSGNIRLHLDLIQGACLIDDSDLDIDVLQERARLACSFHKNDGKCVFYSDSLIARIKKAQEINASFDSAIKNHEFEVYLQPKVRVSDRKIGGAEALVRWTHPKFGSIFPSDFIPVFEKSNKICMLDVYMFEEVCILMKKWMDAGEELMTISVNLSRIHFRTPNFLEAFYKLKEKYGIPDDMIEFEVTESIFVDAQQREILKKSIGDMHEHGFRCSLDDFGVGYSALALLKEFDVDIIKLDRQFFVGIGNQRAQKIVKNFVELSAELGIETVAEGIETGDQLAFVKEISCNMVQGYIFSKPVSIPEFEYWKENFRSGC